MPRRLAQQKTEAGSTSAGLVLKRPLPRSASAAMRSNTTLVSECGSADFCPFLKWAGGKRKLLPVLLRHLPRTFTAYHEPMVGGGALFFALRTQHPTMPMHLSDVNVDLICAYAGVRDHAEQLLEYLRAYPVSEEYYAKLAAMDPDHMRPLARAARTLYLNRCGYNGLFRVNRSGRFNVPWGKYKDPLAALEKLLPQAAQALQGVDVQVRDVLTALARALPGELVYLDPPYHETFTGYAAGAFTERHQERLAAAVREAAARGVLVMVSNNATPFIKRLYSGLRMKRVMAPRSRLSCKGDQRGTDSAELLIRSW